jgi:hypothetical protein
VSNVRPATALVVMLLILLIVVAGIVWVIRL